MKKIVVVELEDRIDVFLWKSDKAGDTDILKSFSIPDKEEAYKYARESDESITVR